MEISTNINFYYFLEPYKNINIKDGELLKSKKSFLERNTNFPCYIIYSNLNTFRNKQVENSLNYQNCVHIIIKEIINEKIICQNFNFEKNIAIALDLIDPLNYLYLERNAEGIKSLVDVINLIDKNNSICIEGHSKSSKSSTLKHCLKPYLEKKGYNVFYSRFSSDVQSFYKDYFEVENIYQLKLKLAADSTKENIIIFDEIDNADQTKDDNIKSFFNSIREIINDKTKYHFKCFIGCGIFGSHEIPVNNKSTFSFDKNVPVNFYFSKSEIVKFLKIITEKTGFEFSEQLIEDILSDIGFSLNNEEDNLIHPGLLSFQLKTLLDKYLKQPTQLSIQIWRKLMYSNNFNRALVTESPIGQRIKKYIPFLDDQSKKKTEEFKLIENFIGIEYIQYKKNDMATKKFLTLGVFNIFGNIVKFSCNRIRSFMMDWALDFPSPIRYNDMKILGKNDEINNLTDIFVNCLQFIYPSRILSLDSDKQFNNKKVPSEYRWQFEICRILDFYLQKKDICVLNEVKNNKNNKRIDFRIANGFDLATVELVVYESEKILIEHLNRIQKDYIPLFKDKLNSLVVIDNKSTPPEKLSDDFVIDYENFELIWISHPEETLDTLNINTFTKNKDFVKKNTINLKLILEQFKKKRKSIEEDDEKKRISIVKRRRISGL
jgi:hypothetical protein